MSKLNKSRPGARFCEGHSILFTSPPHPMYPKSGMNAGLPLDNKKKCLQSCHHNISSGCRDSWILFQKCTTLATILTKHSITLHTAYSQYQHCHSCHRLLLPPSPSSPPSLPSLPSPSLPPLLVYSLEIMWHSLGCLWSRGEQPLGTIQLS